MMTLEQARSNIDQVLAVVINPALSRNDHDLLRMSLGLLYDNAVKGQAIPDESEDVSVCQD